MVYVMLLVIIIVARYNICIAEIMLKEGLKCAISGMLIGGIVEGFISYYTGDSVSRGIVEGMESGFTTGFTTGSLTVAAQFCLKMRSFCFVAGTLVLTTKGLKKIEDVQVGDEIISYDEETETVSPKKVLRTFAREEKELISLLYKANDKIEEIITGLFCFPFLTQDNTL